MKMEKTTLLKLIAVIDGERRFHQVAALLSLNPEDRAQYAHHARCEATAISRVRRVWRARARVLRHCPGGDSTTTSIA